MQLVEFGNEAEPYSSFAWTVDLLGDGSIRLVLTPGHTPGHQSVLVRLQDGRNVLAVGDAAYTLRSIHEQILPMITIDDTAARESLQSSKPSPSASPRPLSCPLMIRRRGISSVSERG